MVVAVLGLFAVLPYQDGLSLKDRFACFLVQEFDAVVLEVLLDLVLDFRVLKSSLQFTCAPLAF